MRLLCTIVMVLAVLSGLDAADVPYSYKTEYYQVPVDHFSFTSNTTFRMRYLYNDSWWDKENGGPIFFYTGNEGDIDLFAQNTGFLWEIAPQFGALVLFAEHRYYGSSLPFGNESLTSPDKSGYLTSEQALADFADFLLYYKYHHGGEESPIIAFGGSYGGMLTAWMRMKYPHVIQGGIAASAPVFQFPGLTACEAFAQIMTNSFARESKECVETIRKSWKYITDFGSTVVGREWLSKKWKLCSPLNSTSDVDNMKAWLTEIYGNLAMINYPYEANFLSQLPAYPVKVFCEKLVDSNLPAKGLLRSIFKGLNVYFNYTGSATCLEVSSSATADLGDKGWDFQSCTEMVMPMCSDGVNDFLEPTPWNYTTFADNCRKKWSVTPNPWMSQIVYGGKDLSTASNIVFSNGLLDPWSGGGVMTNISDSVVTVIIPEGAHHLDLRASNPRDPQSVISARNLERNQIRKWIKEYHSRGDPSAKTQQT